MSGQLKLGARVRVPWGLKADREGIVVDIWGDPLAPSQVRVELEPLEEDGESPVLLLSPSVVTPMSTV